MHKWIRCGLSGLVLCAVSVGPALAATDKTFGAGSLIIPMDGSTYQPGGDGGIYVAYGLVYKLLDHRAADGVTPDPIPVYWIINDQKTSINAADLIVSSTVNPVVKEYTASGEVAISGVTTSISYSGGPFVIDSVNAAAAEAIWATGFQHANLHVAKVPFTAQVQRELYGKPPKLALMNDSESRTGNATKILGDYLTAAGIVNDPTKCNPLNAPVSGPDCVFDVLTPNEVGGIKDLAGNALNGKSLLFDYSCAGCSNNPVPQYNLLWVPHWTGNTNLAGQYQSINPLIASAAGGTAVGGLYQLAASVKDSDDTIMAIRDFVSLGGALFAECASIESVEGSRYGRFLTKFDIGINGGSNNSAYMYVNKNALNQPFPQTGSMVFDPQGGHVHNWRPYQTGDSSLVSPVVPMAFSPSTSDLKATYSQTNTSYDTTVTVFTYDDPPPIPPAGTSPAPDIHNYQNGDQAYDQWHYYVGGYMDGNKDNGFVVYLGGHSYVSCNGSPTWLTPERTMQVNFLNNTADSHGTITITVKFTGGTGSPMTVSGITSANLTTKTTTSGDLTLDLSGASMSGNTIQGLRFVNGGSAALDITNLTLNWTSNTSDKVADIVDQTTGSSYEARAASSYGPNQSASLSEATLSTASSGGYVSGCVPSGSSGAGIRYVLNTLFQLNAVAQKQFVRSAPVAFKDFLYQGSFDYPAFSGHFRKFQVNADLGAGKKGLKIVTGFGTGGDTAPLLTTDTVFTDGNANKAVDTNELSGRNIYASTQTGLETGAVLRDNTLVQSFTFENANLFQGRMSALLPLTLQQTQDVISKRYGMKYSTNTGWAKQANVMGGVEHSAPAIIGPSTLTSASRPTMAYVGALDGMIHAFKAGVNTATSSTDPGEMTGAGEELWSFIPSSQLPKLQYFRDPNALSNFPAVDASLAYSEVPNPNIAGQYITVLLATMGVGGNSVVALDVTNPTASTPSKPILLWEQSGVDVASGSVKMGNGSKVAIGQVKNLSGQTEYRAYVTTALKDKVPCQDQQGVQLGDGSLCGGIQIFSFDLYSGAQKWRFERIYTSGVNDVPGSLALADVDLNGSMDYVVLGDMEGNLWLMPTVPDYDKNGTEDTVIKADSNFTTSTFSSGSPNVIPDIVPLYAPSRDEKTCTGGLTPKTSTTPCYELGQDQPIGISATVVTKGAHTFLAWATGGAGWAGDSYYYAAYVLDITAVNVYQVLDANGKLKGASLTYKFVLDQGEKVFGALTYSEGWFYFATAFGQIEGANPKDNVATNDKGNIRGLSATDVNNNWKYAADGKFRGSVFVTKGEIYATTLDGKIVDVGSGQFAQPSAMKWFKLKSWREIFDLGTNK